MIYLAIDHVDPVTQRPMPNGIPLSQHHLIEQMDGHRLDYPRLLYYTKQCKILRQMCPTADAPTGAWYLITLGWFDFTADYMDMISAVAYNRIKQKQMKLVFTYHEGDSPARIRARLDQLCSQHAVDPAQVWLISGNSTANSVFNCVYWPELEFMYWRTVKHDTTAQYHTQPRSRHFTALCRIDKLWRSVFMSELWAQDLHKSGYFSYTQHLLGSENDYYGCALNNSYLASKQSQVDQFIAAGPFRVDHLDAAAHNNYAHNMTDMYSDSYFNVVLETMIDVDGTSGVFATEKTFKPIINNQFFIPVSSAGHQAHLRELGYKTFGRVIDEHYDTITNNQQRFEAALEETKRLAAMSLDQLHDIYCALALEIQHNSQVFRAGVAHRLRAVCNRINSPQ